MEITAMRPTLNLSLPVTPAAVADAMALVASPDLAARLPESIRRMAWLVAANHAGFRIVQRRSAANVTRRPL
ncbi:hypothetical protein [Paracoccus indicus]|uniref:hypothetical protein n=1 Tax=Paracoccus indicus TaxID=2079229 RepID=UPI000D37FD92|nr:hypothetical protein [Paracoccus indicus]